MDRLSNIPEDITDPVTADSSTTLSIAEFLQVQQRFPAEKSDLVWEFLTLGNFPKDRDEELLEATLKALDHRFLALGAPELFEPFLRILEEDLRNIRVAILLCLDKALLQETIEKLSPPKEIPKFSHILPTSYRHSTAREGESPEALNARRRKEAVSVAEKFAREFREPLLVMTKIVLGQPHFPTLSNHFQNKLLTALDRFLDRTHVFIQRTDLESGTSDTGTECPLESET